MDPLRDLPRPEDVVARRQGVSSLQQRLVLSNAQILKAKPSPIDGTRSRASVEPATMKLRTTGAAESAAAGAMKVTRVEPLVSSSSLQAFLRVLPCFYCNFCLILLQNG